MMNKATLLKTDSYFNIFNILAKAIEKSSNGLDDKTIVFCEEKISLCAEGTICSVKNGSFSTRVFSFGNYLRSNLKKEKVLTKEGSVMAIKKLLKGLPLKCFSKSRQTISSSIYNLIVQLKSAKVSPDDISEAIPKTSGILRNKLEDILLIYKAYEAFLTSGGFDDQSSVLSYLPDVIENNQSIRDTDIILLGYTSWTRQAMNIVKALLKNAKSLTVILNGGENKSVFVNEVESLFLDVCSDLNIEVDKSFYSSPYCKEAKRIVNNIFCPKCLAISKREETSRVNVISAVDEEDEVTKTAEIIKREVIENSARYSDFTIAIPNDDKISYTIRKVFDKLEIPYYLDEKIKGEHTPLVALILDYIEVFRKNFERGSVCNFFKNPLLGLDKSLTDELENYILRYNINYHKFKDPFVYSKRGEPLQRFNEIREQLVQVFSSFNIEKMLFDLNISDRQIELTNKLKTCGYLTQSAVNEQIYDYVIEILQQMSLLLGADASISEIRDTFISGVKALEFSILPQLKDAVFIGGYRQSAIVQNKIFFALDLTSEVPSVKEDVSILSDADLINLENIKVLIEPKIKIVNSREREAVAMALSSFTSGLYVCCPMTGSGGKKNVKSEIFDYLDKLFTVGRYARKNGYLTQKQGVESFSKDCTTFADGRSYDLENASNFYYAVKPNAMVDNILSIANSEISPLLKVDCSLAKDVTSPTKLESYSACPYRLFIESYLNASSRDVGEINALSVGVFIHAILENYAKSLEKVSDRESSDKLVEELVKQLLLDEEYAKYLDSDSESASISRLINEAKENCFKIYLGFSVSQFKPKYIEKKFGSDSKDSLPPIKLLGGKIKLKGKIDRVDEYKDYVRIVDYKTGKVEINKKKLFSGEKLQLYLYGQVLTEKKIAGVYYMPISNSFVDADKKDEETILTGDTLDEREVILAQDETLKDTSKSKVISVEVQSDKISKAISTQSLDVFSTYAYSISEKIAGMMDEGFIPASPAKDACKYCEYRGLCNDRRCDEREIKKVNDQIICDAVNNNGEGD